MNIIELAREAGFFVSTELRDDPSRERFERFAKAVIAARDAELIEGLGEPVAWMTVRGAMWSYQDATDKPLYTAEQVAGAVAKRDTEIVLSRESFTQMGQRITTLESTLRVASEAIESFKLPEDSILGGSASNLILRVPLDTVQKQANALKQIKEVLHD